MDWTGGTRHRYAPKGKRDAVLARQRAHFAKVRASGPPKHFEMPDFMRDAMISKDHQPLTTSSRHKHTDHSEKTRQSRASTVKHPAEHMDYLLRKRPREADEPHATSSVPSSSTRSQTHPNNAKQQNSHYPELLGISDPTAEERLLIANRARLLKHDDWLGLSAARPLRMTYPAMSEKEHIGKRRKIQKERHRESKPARRRSISPLFNETLRHRNDAALMSGALSNQNIDIKIGTDAFATQTQTLASRRSRTSANTSMRQPSTEFGPISEESMLLGVDGDGFEIDANNAVLDNASEFIPTTLASMNDQYHDFLARTTSAAPTFQLSNDSNMPDDHSETRSMERVPDSICSDHSVKGVPCSTNETRAQTTTQYSASFDTRPLTTVAEESDDGFDCDDEDDEMWRNLMLVNRMASGKTSIAALRSSSAHHTLPSTSVRMLPRKPVQAIDATNSTAQRDASEEAVLSPNESGIADAGDDTTTKHDHEIATDTSFPVGSPSASLRQITRLAAQPALPTLQQMVAADDEALWRGMILGSQDTENTTSDLAELAPRPTITDDEEYIEPGIFTTSSKGSTETAQSDRATFGSSVYPTTIEPYIDDDTKGISSDAATNTSMVGHATTLPPEPEDIEDEVDEEVQAPSQATGNIHAASTNSLLDYPRRVKERQQQQKEAVTTLSKFKSGGARASRQERSIYVG